MLSNVRLWGYRECYLDVGQCFCVCIGLITCLVLLKTCTQLHTQLYYQFKMVMLYVHPFYLYMYKQLITTALNLMNIPIVNKLIKTKASFVVCIRKVLLNIFFVDLCKI